MRLASNVELGEVAEVDLHDLHGVDDVIRSLEANIVLPLEHGELAKELDFQPKRGVLLAGPPGTGKTTVGRALAHRLKGKFWLEMSLPDESARRAIVGQLVATLPQVLRGLDLEQLTAAAEGFTAADLKRVIDDGKALYAFDRAADQSLQPITDYFLVAIETVRANKRRYAQAEARANRPPRPPWFDVSQNVMAFNNTDETD
jgi:ATP-dependent 26S proteasome regulatory subunit